MHCNMQASKQTNATKTQANAYPNKTNNQTKERYKLQAVQRSMFYMSWIKRCSPALFVLYIEVFFYSWCDIWFIPWWHKCSEYYSCIYRWKKSIIDGLVSSTCYIQENVNVFTASILKKCCVPVGRTYSLYPCSFFFCHHFMLSKKNLKAHLNSSWE